MDLSDEATQHHHKEDGMATSANKPKFQVPAKVSESWLEEWVPKLSANQARELIASLRSKGWGDRKGSLTDRVYGRLNKQVRGTLERERDKPTS